MIRPKNDTRQRTRNYRLTAVALVAALAGMAVAVAPTAISHDAGTSGEHGEFSDRAVPFGADSRHPDRCGMWITLDDADFRAFVWFRLFLENDTLVEEQSNSAGPDFKHELFFELNDQQANHVSRVEMNYTTSQGDEHSAHASVDPFSCHEGQEDECPSEVSLTGATHEDESVTVEAQGLDREAELQRAEAGTGEFEQVAELDENNTSFRDTGTEAHVTYEYRLVIGGDTCASLEVTAIPVFPTFLAVSIAAIGGLGIYGIVVRQRRK